MQEEKIQEEISWWENKNFIQELNNEYQDWKDGKAKGYSLAEASASIEILKSNRIAR